MNPVTDWLLQQEMSEPMPFEVHCFMQEYLSQPDTVKRVKRVAIAQRVAALVERDVGITAACEAAAAAHSVGVSTARDCYRDYGDLKRWL